MLNKTRKVGLGERILWLYCKWYNTKDTNDWNSDFFIQNYSKHIEKRITTRKRYDNFFTLRKILKIFIKGYLHYVMKIYIEL